MRILLADDEWHLRLMFASLLKEAGLEVVGEASNGVEAVSLYEETQPDLLLMDINMPVLTGDAALREIMAKSPEAKVIMLTSVTDLQTVEKCLDEGALNYIRKDCPLNEILATIHEALSEGTTDGGV